MTIAAAVLTVLAPLALDGEAAVETGANNGTAIATVSLITIVGGYVLLFVLWRCVFSAKAKARRDKAPD